MCIGKKLANHHDGSDFLTGPERISSCGAANAQKTAEEMAAHEGHPDASPRYSAPVQYSSLDGQQIHDVKLWLQEVFNAVGKEAPQFELTARTVAELSRLSQISTR